jgi:DnaJ-class molecular chaperone
VQPGSTRVLGGHGMQRKAGGFGDMVVTFNVQLPTTLTPAQQQQLAQIL